MKDLNLRFCLRSFLTMLKNSYVMMITLILRSRDVNNDYNNFLYSGNNADPEFFKKKKNETEYKKKGTGYKKKKKERSTKKKKERTHGEKYIFHRGS